MITSYHERLRVTPKPTVCTLGVKSVHCIQCTLVHMYTGTHSMNGIRRSRASSHQGTGLLHQSKLRRLSLIAIDSGSVFRVSLSTHWSITLEKTTDQYYCHLNGTPTAKALLFKSSGITGCLCIQPNIRTYSLKSKF